MSAFSLTIRALKNPTYWAFFVPSIILTAIFMFSVEMTKFIFEKIADFESVKWAANALGKGLIILGAFSLKFFLLTLLSPLLAYMSERIDEDFASFPRKFTMSQFIWAILRSVAVAIAALTFQSIAIVVMAIPAWFLSDIIFLIVMFAISSFFLGFAFFDYSLERHRYAFAESFTWFGENALQCFWIGALFNAVTYLPLHFEIMPIYYIGMAMMPAAMTVYATFIFLKRKELII